MDCLLAKKENVKNLKDKGAKHVTFKRVTDKKTDSSLSRHDADQKTMK